MFDVRKPKQKPIVVIRAATGAELSNYEKHKLANIEENAQKDIDFKEVERFIMLKVVDEKWMAHIDAMDELRRGIGLMAYGNHNPVEAYKNEGFDMFDKMIKEIQYDTVKFCLRVNVRRVLVDNSNGPRKIDPSVNPNLNRNGPCPCGSGKKFKHCCGKDEKAE